MTPADAKAWFGAVPPDLSVEAHVRGSDWLYNYFLGFYRDDKSRHRLEQPRVPERRHAARAVAAVRARASWSRPSSKTTRRRSPAAIAVKGLAKLEPGKDGKWLVLHGRSPTRTRRAR